MGAGQEQGRVSETESRARPADTGRSEQVGPAHDGPERATRRASKTATSVRHDRPEQDHQGAECRKRARAGPQRPPRPARGKAALPPRSGQLRRPPFPIKTPARSAPARLGPAPPSLRPPILTRSHHPKRRRRPLRLHQSAGGAAAALPRRHPPRRQPPKRHLPSRNPSRRTPPRRWPRRRRPFWSNPPAGAVPPGLAREPTRHRPLLRP